MRRALLPALCGALLMMLAGPAGLRTVVAQAAPGTPLPESYQVLRDKTMFARQHVKPRPLPRDTQPAAPAKPKPPVLVGILRERGGPLAVFEWPSSGNVAGYHLGDTVNDEHGGKIVDITLDWAALAGAGDAQPRRINVGQDIQGQTAEMPAAPAAAASSGEAGSASTTSGPAGAQSLLERMRARRQQELAK